jgi:hypothetical protein
MGPRDWQWKFYVEGSLTREGAAVPAYEAIVESGVRHEASPHALRGVGPIARPKQDGLFHTWYVTAGSSGRIEIPESISVFLRVVRGKWKPYVVSVVGRPTELVSDSELLIQLGAVPISPEDTVHVSEP